MTRKLSRRPTLPSFFPLHAIEIQRDPTYASTVGECVVYERSRLILRDSHACACTCARVSARNCTEEIPRCETKTITNAPEDYAVSYAFTARTEMRSSCRMRRSDGIFVSTDCTIILRQKGTRCFCSLPIRGKTGPFRI